MRIQMHMLIFDKFPGAYKATDPYANFSIYNGRKAFPMPGPAVWTGGAASGSGSTTPAKEEAAPVVTSVAATSVVAKPTTMVTVTRPAATPAPATPAAPAAGGAALYAQCGGIGFTGAKSCAVGTCKFANDWYSQCQN
jgi:hypothetical protein